MDVEMETSPSYFDPEDLTIREQFRRYGKRQSASSSSPNQENTSSKFSESRLLYDGQSFERRPNAALLLEDIKQEVESLDTDHFEGTPARSQYASKTKSSVDSLGISELDGGLDSIRLGGSYSLKYSKQEDDSLADSGDSTFSLFASLLDSALQVSGLEQDPMPTLELLPKLRALRLFARSFTGKRMVCSNRRFHSLRILKLWMLEEFRMDYKEIG